MEKKINNWLICLLILIIFFSGCISNENIQENELIPVSGEEIVLLGKIDSMRDSIGELHVSPEFADFSNFDDDYIESHTPQKSIIYADRNPNKRRSLLVTKFEKNNWYELEIKNKILRVVITNPLDAELNNLIIQSRDFDERKIDKILPGESKELTWGLDCKKIQPSVYLEIKSKYLSDKLISINDSSLTDKSNNIFVYTDETLWPTSLECPVPAEVSIVKDDISKKPVMVGNDFNAYVIIKNYGDLIAKDVRCELRLPPELTTADNLVKHIDILPRFEKTIDWIITAKEGGTHAFEVVASFGNDTSKAVIFVPVAIDDHDIELVIDKSLLGDDNILHINDSPRNFETHEINMTIKNFGDVEDEVVFQYLVAQDKQYINFIIYDGDARIISQPVIVPPNGNKTVTLKINKYTQGSIPDSTEIQIHATSKLDPTASDKVTFEVKRMK